MASAGTSQGPTPWWQLPDNSGKLDNLSNSAPSGYQYDPVQMRYMPIVNSPADQITQRNRTQGIQNQALATLNGALGGLGSSGSGGSVGVGGSGNGPSINSGLPSHITSVGSVPQVSPMQTPPPLGASRPAPATVSGQSTIAPMTLPAHVQAGAGPSADQLKASDDATFARTKDTAANTMQAAMRGLTGQMAARGMGGAGYEAGQIGQTLSQGANTIGEADRQHAQQQYDAAQTLQQEELQADLEQRGQDIGATTTTRGQDIGAQQAANAGLVTQRGQDINSADNARSQDLSARGQDLSAAESNLSGGIAQRGQDIGANTAGMSNETTQRGQDIQAQIAQNNITAQKQQSLLNLALGGLSRITPSLSY